MSLKKMAEEILTLVGGKENVVSVTHCVTRIRFALKDETIADDKKIKAIEKVLGVMHAGGQYQVVVGNIVKSVYENIEELLNESDQHLGGEQEVPQDETRNKLDQIKAKNKEKLINRLSRTLMNMIFPLIPTMAAVGILKGCLSLFVLSGILNPKDGTYIILSAANDAFLYFLPIIVAFSVAKTLKSNPYVGAVIGASLVLPAIVTAYNDGAALTFLKIPVVLTTYGNSIFPVMIATFIAAKLEKQLDKFIPVFLEFLKIMILVVIMVPITFLVIGPIFTQFSKLLASGTMGVYELSPIIAGVLFGAFWQLCVLFGLHYAFIPILTDITLRMGSNSFNPILAMGVWALAGAALGFALKAKRKEQKATGYSAMTSALFGITEPAIFGIALPFRKPFVCAMIAGAVGGLLTPLLGTTQYYPAVVGGLLSFGAHMNPSGDPRSIIGYFITFFVTFIISTILTYFTMGKKEFQIAETAKERIK